MDFSIRWQDSSYFYLLLFVVVYMMAFFFSEKKSKSRLVQAFGVQVTRYLSRSVSITKRRLQLTLQALGLVFIIVALARPQAGESQQEIKSEGVELLVLTDVSDSMLAEDVRPSRLQQMKIELAKLLELMPGNKIGMIAFAGSSSLLSPLTTDPNALRMYIDSLDTNSVSNQGTNVETALAYAQEAFQKGGVTQDASVRTTRAVLVLSDGEDHEQGALETARKLSQEGIRIYTIAYGTEKGGAIPSRDNYGNMNGYKKDKSGQPILSQVHGDFLKSLAEAGQGHFYFAYFNGDHLKSFVSDLGQLEKTQFQSNMMTQYEEKFTWPLLLGLLFILISLLVSDRHTKTAEWVGRYEQN